MKKTKNDEPFFFKANKSDYNKDTTVLRFTIPYMDTESDDTTQFYREMDLNVFDNDFEKLKATIIPEHKDMYKDIFTKQMEVDCGKENCGGNKLIPPPPPAPANPTTKPEIKSLKPPGKGARDKAREALPKLMPPPSIRASQVTEQDTYATFDGSLPEYNYPPEYHGGGKKKKKRRKKSSRSKKRRNKRKNRTKKN